MFSSTYTSLSDAIHANSIKKFRGAFNSLAPEQKSLLFSKFNDYSLISALLKTKNNDFILFLIESGLSVLSKPIIYIIINKADSSLYTKLINNKTLGAFYLKEILDYKQSDQTFSWLAPSPKLELVRHLLSLGCDLSPVSRTGVNLLQLSTYSQPATVKLLLDANIFDINYQDYSGVTALHYATHNGNSEIIKLLLSAGARLDILNKFNESPIFTLVQRGINKDNDILSLMISSYPNRFELIKEYYRYKNNTRYLDRQEPIDLLMAPLLQAEKNDYVASKIGSLIPAKNKANNRKL